VTSWNTLKRGAWSALLGATFLLIGGCSSSTTTTTRATGGGAGTANSQRDASAGNSAGGGGGTSTFDGTSGVPCTTDQECQTGAGINVCSNSYSGQLNDLNGVTSPQFWPTPLCIVPLPTLATVGNCDPGEVGELQFCDSADPTDPSSPGICIPLTTPQQAGPANGYCLPHCTFNFDGTAASGCPGKDTCNAFNYLLDTTTNTIQGHGFCQGTCQADADCSDLGAGWVCQADLGVCTTTKKARSKAIGAACTNSGNDPTPLATSDTETGACNCPFSGTGPTQFYCTQACVVGGNPCPTGYVCDALIPGQLAFTADDGGDLILTPPAVQNPGLAGTCLAKCTNPVGPDGVVPASGDGCPGSTSNPPLSTCTAPTDPSGSGTAAGPDCQP
jgi:hypothetical protein